MAAWCLMTTWVMHGLAVKLCTVFGWMLAASRHRSVIAFAVIEMMVDVSVKMIRPMIPGTRTNKHTA